jgi:hypothetical protein
MATMTPVPTLIAIDADFLMGLRAKLARNGTAELITFDNGLKNQANAEAPSVKVRLLIASPPAGPPAGGAHPIGG